MMAVVSICENDEHGMERGLCCAAHFATGSNADTPPELELESCFIDEEDEPTGPSCERIGNMLIIGGEPFMMRGFKAHVGNVHWNGYLLGLGEAQRLARMLRAVHGFSIEGQDLSHPFFVTGHHQ